MLTITNFSKTYAGGKKAVDNLSLTVNAGEIMGFIGHNGAGKTTTLRAVAGILDFTEGEIVIDAVILVKDLKVKGSSSVLKKGSKIKGIRLVDGADGHNVDCKTDLGSMLLKSEFLKKA